MSADEIFAAFPTLSTPRLTLRQIRTEDAAAVFGLFGDAEVTRYYDLDTFTEPLQAEELIEKFQRRFDHRIGLRWGLALNETPDNLIGTCGYNLWVQPARRGLVGYDLARDHWRRGLMTEALAAVLTFRFHRHGPQPSRGADLPAKYGFQIPARQTRLSSGRPVARIRVYQGSGPRHGHLFTAGWRAIAMKPHDNP